VFLDDVGLVELEAADVVLLHVAVVLGFFELFEGFDDIGEHFDFLLLGELGVKVVGLEGFLQERQHHEVGDEEVVVPLPGFRLQHEVLVESLVVNYAFHAFEVAVIELRSQILRVAVDTAHPGLLALGLVPRKVQSHCLVVQQIRFVLLLVKETAPQQVFSVLEVFCVELKDLRNEVVEGFAFLGFGGHQFHDLLGNED
jgi:hypothetical protein